jgi:hypothetical protein
MKPSLVDRREEDANNRMRCVVRLNESVLSNGCICTTWSEVSPPDKSPIQGGLHRQRSICIPQLSTNWDVCVSAHWEQYCMKLGSLA